MNVIQMAASEAYAENETELLIVHIEGDEYVTL